VAYVIAAYGVVLISLVAYGVSLWLQRRALARRLEEQRRRLESGP
jgi:heme exporter protein D